MHRPAIDSNKYRMSKKNVVTFRNTGLDLEFDFSINGYEFPDDADDDWLLVGIECRYQGKVFVKEDPSLDAPELEKICEWFQSISHNTIPEYTYLSFTEPNLEFQLFRNKGGKIRFGIKLDLECKPPFFIRELTMEPVEPGDEFVMVFENSLQEITDYFSMFQKLSTSFPCRGEP